MTNLPPINRMKFGIIDQNYMNTLAQAANEFNDMKARLNDMSAIASKTSRAGKHMLARIQSSTPIASAEGTNGEMDIAWRYAWQRISFTELTSNIQSGEEEEMYDEDLYPDTTTQDTEQALGEGQGYAYNLAELSNIMTAPILNGVNITGEGYPEGYYLRDITLGSFVLLYPIVDIAGNFSYLFERQNIHDGSCE